MKKKTPLSSKHYNHVVIPEISEKILVNTRHGCISCKKSHDISKKLNINPEIVGNQIEMAKMKIIMCQLGLFGHKDEYNGKKPPESITSKLKSCIIFHENNSRLTCRSAWILSRKLNCKKTDVSFVCETLGIRISECQLGAF